MPKITTSIHTEQSIPEHYIGYMDVTVMLKAKPSKYFELHEVERIILEALKKELNK